MHNLVITIGIRCAVGAETRKSKRSAIYFLIAPTDWTRVARVCNSYLGEGWGPPPWDERRWFVLFDSLQSALAGSPEAIETDELDCDD